MKKSLVIQFLFILVIILSAFALAQENESIIAEQQTEQTGVQQAYQCLEDLIDDRDEDSLSLQEATFGALALGSDSKLLEVIEDEEDNDCWPDNDCTLKETSQVLLAYDRINRNTADIEEYLLDQNDTSTDLSWNLIIDITNHEPSECTIRYGSSDRTIDINEDMTIEGNPGSCLDIVNSGFWLRVRDSCLDETYEVSCDQDFVTSLIYQKENSNTFYVSPNTHSAASSGTTVEEINAQCFEDGGSCDYEGTLWATLALDKAGYDISSFIPYLQALGDDHKNLLPSSFLYALTSADNQFSTLANSQNPGGFWQAPSTSYNKFYDTALALSSLGNSPEAEDARNYLLDVQTPQGCWNNNNIRDTAFLLYAGWPTSVPSSGGSGGAIESCASAGFSCESRFACLDSGGQVNNNYACTGFGEVCCTTSVALTSCTQKGGITCSASQSCSGSSVPSLDGQCCLGACLDSPSQTACESAGGICAFSCNEDETQTSLSCGTGTGLLCCESSGTSSSSGLGTVFWIIFLVVLIALVALGIIFRHKLQLWWFKLRKKMKSKSTPVRPSRPGPGPGRPGLPPRRPFPPRGPPPGFRPVRQQPSKNDKDMDEVFKKLKDMGK